MNQWYLNLLPLYFTKKQAEKLVAEQKAIAQDVVDEAELKLKEADKRLKELSQGNFLVKPENEVEFCFEASNGKNWKFVDEQKIPAGRAMHALDIYAKLEERTDKNYHKLAYQAIIDQANKGQLVKVANIAQNALDRVNHIANADLMYELASVLYFDEHENPYEYSYEYAEKKIALWRKDGLESFFSRTPLKDYLPSFGSSSMNFQIYTDAQRKELLLHLKNHLSQLSGDPKNSDLKTSTLLEIEKLNQLIVSKS
jgi:hypothetical protein